LTTFFDVAYTSYLPSLVDAHELVEGNSKLTASNCMAQVVAFGLAGWLVEWLTAPGAIAVDALSFLASAASLLLIRSRERPVSVAAGAASVRREIGEGIRAIRADARLSAIAAGVAGLSAGWGLGGAVFMLFGNRELGFEPGVLGLIYASGGLASFFGAMLAGRSRERLGAGGAMTMGLLLTAIGFLAMAGAPGATLLGAALLVAQQLIGDPGFAIFEVNQVSLRQKLAPALLLGRVNAGVRFVSLTSMLIGSLLAGAIAERYGSRPVLLMAGLAALGGAAAVHASPLRTYRESASGQSA